MTTTSPATPATSPVPVVALLGGTGMSGRRVATRLHGRGATPRPLSRRSTPAFDWADPRTHRPALAGADAAYLAYHPDIAFPGAADQIAAVAAAAADEGVRRLVLLSGRGEPEAIPAEDAVRGSGVPWTVLRCAWFMQDFSEHVLLLPHVLAGEIVLPAGDAAEPFVDLDDVAEVAVAALLDGAHTGATLDLTGPESLGFATTATLLSDALGHPVAYRPVDAAAYGDVARAAGMLEPDVAPMTALFTRLLDGHNAAVTPDLRTALGRAPGTFAAFARRAAAAGAWRAER